MTKRDNRCDRYPDECGCCHVRGAARARGFECPDWEYYNDKKAAKILSALSIPKRNLDMYSSECSFL